MRGLYRYDATTILPGGSRHMASPSALYHIGSLLSGVCIRMDSMLASILLQRVWGLRLMGVGTLEGGEQHACSEVGRYGGSGPV